MSNHPSENTKGRLLRRALAGVLTLALMLGLLPASVFTAHAASWADSYVQTLVDWGVMRGDIGGNMAPDRSITRAEFVTMMNRAYGYKKLGGHPFTDVRVRDWYNEDIDIAYNIGYFKGTSDTTASPNSSLTREQAAVLLARNMMLQETVGETLGFSDTRRLSDWSRGLVGAAAANGIIGGYEDGSFQPMRNITRGEVAAMLVRAIGTPIQEAGDHALGNVYGNVTVNTSGVKLRDGVIAGNLYLTGGIDLGDVLLENVTVLGQIIVSGGGESNSSQSSIVLRNVVADKMVVDSISSQFVTIRAEGNTDIPTTTVRTNAYVDDSSLPGYGLSFIELDGEEGALYQLAGNIKEVINKTPGSSLQVVQGVADKVTVDEKATGSNVLVDGDAQVGDLNLDTGTEVTGTGDIENLNVGSAGSTVEQLPDQIVIRPGIDADIGGSNMNSSQGAEASADPKLLAGYPAVRKIAPNSAELVFRVNKPGTIYWAVSSVADGSVSEADLMDPPTYGNRVLASGTITATAANTDYTASVSKLTSAGSYYVTAMLVDGRDEHSPIKVTSFTTPDNSVPAFATGYPVMTMVTTEIAQVTVMTTKSCLLYYALLPKGAKAPTEAEFKSAAIPGNLGYGSQSVTKNVTIPINVNSVPLEEKTDYVLYLWLVDHDGAQKSRVVSLPFTTLDETPPVVTDAKQLFSNTTPTADSIQVEYTIDEPADFVWAIVTESDHMRKSFLTWTDENQEPGDPDRFTLEFADEATLLSAKVQLASGAGALLSGSSNRSPLTIRDAKLLFANAKTSSFVLYYMGDDNATSTGNLSDEIKALRVRTKDETPPDVSLRFSSDGAEVTENPQADADVRIRFTEQVKGTNTKGKHILLELYQEVEKAQKALEEATGDDAIKEANKEINKAKDNMAKALDTYIELHKAAFPTVSKLTPLTETKAEDPPDEGSWINWRNAQITMPPDGSGNLEILLPGVRAGEGGTITDAIRKSAAIQMEGGVTYYFRFRDIYDLAYPTGNALVQGTNDPCYREFTTSFAKINLSEGETWDVTLPDGLPKDSKRVITFLAEPTTVDQVGDEFYWDMLIWTNTTMEFYLYSRPKGGTNAEWMREGAGTTKISVTPGDKFVYRSLNQNIRGLNNNGEPPYTQLNKYTKDMEYAIYIKSLNFIEDSATWNYPDLEVRVSFVAGTREKLFTHVSSGTQTNYDNALKNGVSRIEEPSPFTIKKPIQVMGPPTIDEGFPTISVTDTSATINLTMDKAGYVYYLLLPLENMSDGNGYQIDTTLTTLTDGLLDSVKQFGMYKTPKAMGSTDLLLPQTVTPLKGSKTEKGVAVSTPDQGTVTGSIEDLSALYPQGCAPAESGPAAPLGTQITIRLVDKLTPNTAYYLFLVTKNANAELAENPVCYRFFTQPPQRPSIQVTQNGKDGVNVTTNKDVHLWYYLAPNGEEGGILPDPFTGDYTNASWRDTNGWTSNNGLFKYTSADNKAYTFLYTRNGGDRTKMTIVDAMATPCYLGAIGQNYQGSVFDVFADVQTKTACYSIITGSTTETGGAVANDEADITPTKGTSPKFTKLDPGTYTFVCVGLPPSGQGSTPAFRAHYSITAGESNHPTVISYTPVTWPANTTKFDGEFTLVFSDPLYFGTTVDNWTDYKKLCTCGLNVHPATNDKTGCTPLGTAFISTSVVQAVTVSDHAKAEEAPEKLNFKITGLPSTTTTIVNFKRGLCNEDHKGVGTTLMLNLSIAKVEDASADGYHYELRVTIPSADWNGLPTT